MNYAETQASLFDIGGSIAARDLGIAQAVDNKKSLVDFARKIAREIAQGGKDISMDDVAAALLARDISIFALGNAAGGIFQGKEWEWTGKRVKSVRKHAHGNEIKVWRLRK